MDEMNPLEKLLQSWTPRRPSPEIARRLFASGKAAYLAPLAARRSVELALTGGRLRPNHAGGRSHRQPRAGAFGARFQRHFLCQPDARRRLRFHPRRLFA